MSRHQQIAEIGSQCWSRANNLQPGIVEAGHVKPYTPEWLAKSQCADGPVTSAAPEDLVLYSCMFQFS